MSLASFLRFSSITVGKSKSLNSGRIICEGEHAHFSRKRQNENLRNRRPGPVLQSSTMSSTDVGRRLCSRLIGREKRNETLYIPRDTQTFERTNRDLHSLDPIPFSYHLVLVSISSRNLSATTSDQVPVPTLFSIRKKRFRPEAKKSDIGEPLV